MRPSTAAFAVPAALVVMLAASRAGAQSTPSPAASAAPVEAEPPLYPPPSTRWKLLGAGVLTTGVWYGTATGFSYMFPDAPGAHDLRTPVIGPWQAIAHNGCPDTDPDCSKVWVAIRTVLTALDGIGQAGGVGIFLEGLFVPTQERAAAPASPAAPSKPAPKRTEPEPSQPPPATPTGPNLFYVPTPVNIGKNGVGLAWGGTF
jgi:hypothetical protein